MVAECVKYCEVQRTLDIYRNLQDTIPEKNDLIWILKKKHFAKQRGNFKNPRHKEQLLQVNYELQIQSVSKA